MANGVYNRAKFLIADGALDLPTTADLRVLLVKSTYTFDPDSNFVSDVIAGSQEISVGGYARQALANETLTEDDANDFAYLDADDAVFASLAAGQTVGGAVVFKFNASDAAAEVIAFYDVTDTATNGGNITTVPTATLLAETTLAAGQNVVSISAPTATLQAETILAAGGNTITITAPTATIVGTRRLYYRGVINQAGAVSIARRIYYVDYEV